MSKHTGDMPIESKYDLNLPDAPDFISKPPRCTWIEMAKMCEKMLPHWNKARRWEAEIVSIDEDFTLD